MVFSTSGVLPFAYTFAGFNSADTHSGTTVTTLEAGAIVGATVDWIKSNNTRVSVISLSPFPRLFLEYIRRIVLVPESFRLRIHRVCHPPLHHNHITSNTSTLCGRPLRIQTPFTCPLPFFSVSVSFFFFSLSFSPVSCTRVVRNSSLPPTMSLAAMQRCL